MGGNYELRRSAGLLVLALALLLPAGPGRADDSDLFSTAVTPNVMLYVDNSGSMNNVVWHPAFDPTKASSAYGCTYWADDGGEEYYTSNSAQTRCGNSRTIFNDPAINPDQTRWSHRYLNWYFSNATNALGTSGVPIWQEVFATSNGTNGACAVALGAPATYHKYRRTRVTAVQDVIRNVICDVNDQGAVRFGLAQFRLPGSSNDPNGAFVLVPVNDYNKVDVNGIPITPKVANTYALNGVTQSHEMHLKSAITAIGGDSWTPLGEGLFQLYTYFMSRDTTKIPVGKDLVTKFPKYVYKTDNTTSGNGGSYSTSGAPTVPDSPVQYSCQKNFVILLTDGEPTMDDFSKMNTSDNTWQGFPDFKARLIGEYNTDNVQPEGGTVSVPKEDTGNAEKASYYLDDIAKYMHDKDFRPDMTGSQTFDIYTVGFTTGTNTPADYLLRKTASVGGGTAYSSNDPDALADSIVSSVADIVQKSQAFTAATVPATRTAAGGNFYTSLLDRKSVV
jgi:type IV pilus assembly protein PilY1